MKQKKSFMYFILLLMREITLALTGTSLLQYDITKTFDQWLSNLLKFDNSRTIWLMKHNIEFVSHKEYYLKELEFEYDLHHEVKPFESKFVFYNVVYYVNDFQPFSHIDWNLKKDRISIPSDSESYRFEVEGELRITKEKHYCRFNATLDFKNFELRWINVSSGLFMDISYDNFTVENFEPYEVAMQWNNTMDVRQKKNLAQELKPAFIPMLRENIKRVRPRFDPMFESITEVFDHAQQDYPDMFKKERKYYYLIPKTPFSCECTLKAIVLKGLPIIKSLKFGTHSSSSTYSLLMKNVHGSAMLDYGLAKQKPLKLNFKINSLSMLVDSGSNCVTFEAPRFNANSTSGPLTHLQSSVLLQSIESALVSSLMPMNKICKLDDKATVPWNVMVNSSSPWETRKKLCNEWIPFIDEA